MKRIAINALSAITLGAAIALSTAASASQSVRPLTEGPMPNATATVVPSPIPTDPGPDPSMSPVGSPTP